jgi:hypothetical protein
MSVLNAFCATPLRNQVDIKIGVKKVAGNTLEYLGWLTHTLAEDKTKAQEFSYDWEC